MRVRNRRDPLIPVELDKLFSHSDMYILRFRVYAEARAGSGAFSVIFDDNIGSACSVPSLRSRTAREIVPVEAA